MALEPFIEHQLRSSARHRHFMSIVVMSSHNGASDIRLLLGDAIRDSDALFVSGREAVLVMPETEQMGALKAVMRFRTRTDRDSDVRFGVSTYPVDGQGGWELMEVGRRRLRRAMGLKRGAVVASG